MKNFFSHRSNSLYSGYFTPCELCIKRDQLIERIWGLNTNTEDRTVDSHIRNLRDKLRKANFPIDHHLKTVYGVGYRWIDTEH